MPHHTSRLNMIPVIVVNNSLPMFSLHFIFTVLFSPKSFVISSTFRAVPNVAELFLFSSASDRCPPWARGAPRGLGVSPLASPNLARHLAPAVLKSSSSVRSLFLITCLRSLGPDSLPPAPGAKSCLYSGTPFWAKLTRHPRTPDWRGSQR